MDEIVILKRDPCLNTVTFAASGNPSQIVIWEWRYGTYDLSHIQEISTRQKILYLSVLSDESFVASCDKSEVIIYQNLKPTRIKQKEEKGEDSSKLIDEYTEIMTALLPPSPVLKLKDNVLLLLGENLTLTLWDTESNLHPYTELKGKLLEFKVRRVKDVKGQGVG